MCEPADSPGNVLRGGQALQGVQLGDRGRREGGWVGRQSLQPSASQQHCLASRLALAAFVTQDADNDSAARCEPTSVAAGAVLAGRLGWARQAQRGTLTILLLFVGLLVPLLSQLAGPACYLNLPQPQQVLSWGPG